MPAKQEDIDKINRAKTLYEILDQNKEATLQQITKSYRRLSLVFHPDKNYGSEAQVEPLFKKIRNAYDILSDDQRRREYDAILHQESARPKEQESARPKEQESARPKEQESARPKEQESARPKEQESARPKEQESARPKEQESARPKEQESAKRAKNDNLLKKEVIPLVKKLKDALKKYCKAIIDFTNKFSKKQEEKQENKRVNKP